MLDHVFTDAIGALRDALEKALLERQAFEERFHSDFLLGDVTWATAYGLPGEGTPPRVQADLTLDWPTWSQTAYRLWYLEEEVTDPPQIEIEVAFRIQRLAALPPIPSVLGVMPDESSLLGSQRLVRASLSVEQAYSATNVSADPQPEEFSIEVGYEGAYTLDESTLADGSELDLHFGSMGGWIAATLVRLGDLKCDFLPPSEEPG